MSSEIIYDPALDPYFIDESKPLSPEDSFIGKLERCKQLSIQEYDNKIFDSALSGIFGDKIKEETNKLLEKCSRLNKDSLLRKAYSCALNR